MIFPHYIVDIHTHTAGRPDAIASVDPVSCVDAPQTPMSVGVHPWSAWPDAASLERLERFALLPNTLAIGEAGIDKRRSGMTLEQQIELLRMHAALSERVGKPLILHVVGGWNEVMGLRAELKPRQMWIIHGFRGKPQLARQLLKAGFGLSYGERFNPEAWEATPPDRRFSETD